MLITRPAARTAPALAMWTGRVLLFLLAAALSLTTAPAKNDPWDGKPSFEAGESKGYFIWNDDEGWHVRWTTKNKKHAFSGTLTCDGSFVRYEAVSKGKKDFIKQTGKSRIEFDAQVDGGKDGFDFQLTSSTATITFDLEIDGKAAPIDSVKMGSGKTRPAAVPFTITRKGETQEKDGKKGKN